jgi:hypothetical protein
MYNHHINDFNVYLLLTWASSHHLPYTLDNLCLLCIDCFVNNVNDVK